MSPEPQSVASLLPAYRNQETLFAGAWELLDRAIASRCFPGASVAVTWRSKLVALKGLGRFTYDEASPQVTPDTIYDIASVSKVLATTTAAMILYERGELDLDLPVAAVLPQFAASDPRRPRISLRMLLAHSSGVPGYEPLFQRCRTREELLAAAITLPLSAEPGSRVEYSDIGFIVLGEILARLADEPLDRFCQRHIFGPLGLTHTTFNPPPGWKPAIPPTEDDRNFRHRVIQGEVHDENASVLGGVAGHAGAFSTAHDLARFAHCLLGGGAPLVRPETVALFIRPESLARNQRALGWDLPSRPSQSGSYFSPRSFGHLGFTGCSLWIDPEKDLSVALLTNRTWPQRASQAIKSVRPEFHDALLGVLVHST